MKRIIVCGGRDYADRAHLFHKLDYLHAMHGLEMVIHGAQTGADTLAGEWARSRGVEEDPVLAKWDELGRAAGPIRNAAMLKRHPDAVIAFSGGKGTANMVGLARNSGIEVRDFR